MPLIDISHIPKSRESATRKTYSFFPSERTIQIIKGQLLVFY